MARRKRLIMVLAVCGMLSCVFAFLSAQFSEPKYQGQPLSHWVIKLNQGNNSEQIAAREALRAMSRSAVPHLARRLREDSPLKLKLLSYASKFPLIRRILKRNSDQDRAYAATALGEIGPLASNAIPALLTACRRTNALSASWVTPRTTAALMKIRNQPIQDTIRKLETMDPTNWPWTANLVAEFGTNAAGAVPALCRALSDNNRLVRMTAATALGRIHSDAALAVPALIRAIDAGNTDNTIWALGRFEGEAKSAIPVLTLQLVNRDAMVRQSTFASLFLILPADERKMLVPYLIDDMRDPNPNLSIMAEFYLRQIDLAAAQKTKAK